MVWASFLSAAKAATLPNAYGAAEGVPFQGLAAFSKTYHRHRAWQQCLARGSALRLHSSFAVASCYFAQDDRVWVAFCDFSALASCSRIARSARNTSSAAVAFKTNFNMPSGVNCVPR